MRHIVPFAVLASFALAPTLAAAPPPIPLVDLAGDDARRVVVDREPGQYLGHPSTLLLEDGRTILCAYPRGHGRGAIVLKRSPDGGRSWSERLPTPASWTTSQETPTLHRVIDAEGTRRIILFSGLHPVRRALSADDGATWSELEPVGDWGGIVTMASVVAQRGAPGRHLALFHDDGRFIAAGGRASGTFTLYGSRSTDGGLTWAPPESILASADLHLCEPGAIRSPDGDEIALLLRENRRVAPSQVILSRDEGATWTSPRPLPNALCGDRHVARYAPDGRLFISFRDVPPKGVASETAGDWVGWVGRYEDLLAGGDGAYRVRLGDNRHAWDCAYPGVEVLPDGTIVATTYGHWIEGEPPFVVSMRFTLDELDARLDAAAPATDSDSDSDRDR